MNTYKNETKSVTGSVSQRKSNNEFSPQFADKRQEAIKQEALQGLADNSSKAKQLAQFQEMANGQSQNLKPGISNDPNPIQRMVAVDLLVDDDKKKKIRGKGEVKDFKGGTAAGKYGWLGVSSYRSSYSITDGTNVNEDTVGPLANDFTNPEAGHVLANQNGGDGTDTWNIFAQDGGTNNGKYKAFEIKMRKDLDLYEDDDEVTFTSYLKGVDIEDSGKIADAGKDNASDISSEDSD